MVDEDGDVFDSYARCSHGPALKANNIMRRLVLHCRDCFDLVSKYLMTLKTYPCVGCVSGEHRH